eukprot:scaffold269002_cov18-Tisochrysis_lutea.AAC.1
MQELICVQEQPGRLLGQQLQQFDETLRSCFCANICCCFHLILYAGAAGAPVRAAAATAGGCVRELGCQQQRLCGLCTAGEAGQAGGLTVGAVKSAQQKNQLNRRGVKTAGTVWCLCCRMSWSSRSNSRGCVVPARCQGAAQARVQIQLHGLCILSTAGRSWSSGFAGLDDMQRCGKQAMGEAAWKALQACLSSSFGGADVKILLDLHRHHHISFPGYCLACAHPDEQESCKA